MTIPALAYGQRWYVAFTQANAELRAALHLQNQGFSTYNPRFLKRRRRGRKTEQVVAPLFPRYVFVGIDLDHQRWRSVNGTIGVSYLVCQGERPAPVDECVVEAIAEREDAGGLVQLALECIFKPGQSVRVTDGIFADHLGLYEGLGDRDRIRILLSLLGREVRVQIETNAVVAA